jgi:group I intron endonuclease
MVGIYKITNVINGKIYVGQSIDIKDRWYQHKYKATDPNELGYNSAIHQAFRKYGIDNFSFEIIEECAPEQLDDREIYWIKQLNSLAPNGYNILEGGQGQGRKTTFKHPLICSNCGKEISRHSSSGLCTSCSRLTCFITKEELYAKLIESKGNFTEVGHFYNMTDNAIRKRCKNFGLPYHSQDYKEKNTSAKTKKPYRRKVKQIDPENGIVLQVFNSLNEAARSLGYSKGNHITEACQGKIPTAYGYKWEYAD